VFFDDERTSETYAEQITLCPGCGKTLERKEMRAVALLKGKLPSRPGPPPMNVLHSLPHKTQDSSEALLPCRTPRFNRIGAMRTSETPYLPRRWGNRGGFSSA
jgi:hypothetical protein